MSFDPFIVWWVSEVGHPPTAAQSEAFVLARKAWVARGQLDSRPTISASSRPLLASGRRPNRKGED